MVPSWVNSSGARSVCVPPLPERWGGGFGSRPSLSAPSALGFIPLGWGQCPMDGAGRRVPPRRLWDGVLVAGHSLSLWKPACSRQTHWCVRGVRARPRREQRGRVLMDWGKLRHGAGQTQVLPLPAGGGDTDLSPSPLCPMALRVCLGGTHRGPHPPRARRLSCARRLAWGGRWGRETPRSGMLRAL